MNTDNAFIKFISELFARLKEKSPKFFKVLRIIFAIPTIVIAIPEALILFKVEVPEAFKETWVKVIGGFTTAGWIMTFFPVKDDDKPAVKEKLPFTKSVSMILVMVLLSLCGISQNFFKPIGPVAKAKQIRGIIATPVVEPTFWSFRPSLLAATLFIGGTVEAAGGAGIAYQNITQKGPEARNYVNYDIGLYMLAGGSVVRVDSVKSDIEKIALVATALNGTVGLGYAFSRQQSPGNLERKWKSGLCLVWKINLNN